MYQKGLEKYYGDLDLVSIITTVRRLRSLTDVVLSENQKALELYSKYYNVGFVDRDQVDYLKSLPKYKSKKHNNRVFEYNARVNGFIQVTF